MLHDLLIEVVVLGEQDPQERGQGPGVRAQGRRDRLALSDP
jgi:hypothetical protein